MSDSLNKVSYWLLHKTLFSLPHFQAPLSQVYITNQSDNIQLSILRIVIVPISLGCCKGRINFYLEGIEYSVYCIFKNSMIIIIYNSQLISISRELIKAYMMPTHRDKNKNRMHAQQQWTDRTRNAHITVKWPTISSSQMLRVIRLANVQDLSER